MMAHARASLPLASGRRLMKKACNIVNSKTMRCNMSAKLQLCTDTLEVRVEQSETAQSPFSLNSPLSPAWPGKKSLNSLTASRGWAKLEVNLSQRVRLQVCFAPSALERFLSLVATHQAREHQPLLE